MFLAVAEEDHQSYALPRDDLCSFLYVATSDGLAWDVSLTDEVKSIVDTGPDPEEDLPEQQLSIRPGVVRAEHVEREGFEVSLARAMRAEEMLARYINALNAAHREFARRRGIDIGD